MGVTGIADELFQRLYPAGVKSPKRRIELLRRLRRTVNRREGDILEALWLDLRKPRGEAYMSELFPALQEIKLAIRRTERWARVRKVSSSMLIPSSSAYVQPQPLGRVLIYAPWNYPFLLLLQPLINALSAGNCALLSPSPSAPETARVVGEIVEEALGPAVAMVLKPGELDPAEVLGLPFDLIFYTGGPGYAKEVARSAGERLIPCILELGGKSPCIIAPGADLGLAAKRIAWGKVLNAGQTCVAPDYILVGVEEANTLIGELKRELDAQAGMRQRGESSLRPLHLPLVRSEELLRAERYLRGQNVVHGGKIHHETSSMTPTVVLDPAPDAPIMQEELFLPILPVVRTHSLEESIAYVNARPKPLAVYAFGKREEVQRIVDGTSSGTLAVNDTILQLAHPDLPFGGVGASGYGRYHGEFGFEAFSHHRAVLQRGGGIDIPFRYRLHRIVGMLRLLR